MTPATDTADADDVDNQIHALFGCGSPSNASVGHAAWTLSRSPPFETVVAGHKQLTSADWKVRHSLDETCS